MKRVIAIILAVTSLGWQDKSPTVNPDRAKYATLLTDCRNWPALPPGVTTVSISYEGDPKYPDKDKQQDIGSVEDAILEWERVAPKAARFQIIPEGGKLPVKLGHILLPGPSLGITNFKLADDKKHIAVPNYVLICCKNYDYNFKERPATKKEVYELALHEFGHVLGLTDNYKYVKDIMHFESEPIYQTDTISADEIAAVNSVAE